jgi:glucose-6-phosphate isomerase
MKKLPLFGFPVVFNETDNMLLPDAEGISYEKHSRKYSKAMFGLLSDSNYTKTEEPYYDFYLSIGVDADRSVFQSKNLRFDSTVIMSGLAGDEFKKTSGHFHCEVPGKGMSYPEYYQVIKGKALFIMQKVTDCQSQGKMVVEDILLAEVNAGESIVIPPDYGHCTVNISDETMVFINLVSYDSNNFYDSVKSSAGMCCYIKKGSDKNYVIEKNPNYQFAACEPKVVTPCSSEALGITKDRSVYELFLKQPNTYGYLDNPENTMNEFLAAFKDK